MSDALEAPAKAPRFLGLPRTRFGWSSIVLAAAFFVFFWLFWLQRNAPRDRSTFFSDPINALLLISAVASAITGGVTAVAAIIRKRERSFLLLPTLLLGIFVLFFTVGELIGHG